MPGDEELRCGVCTKPLPEGGLGYYAPGQDPLCLGCYGDLKLAAAQAEDVRAAGLLVEAGIVQRPSQAVDLARRLITAGWTPPNRRTP